MTTGHALVCISQRQLVKFFSCAQRDRGKQVATYSGTETTIYIGGLLKKMTVIGGTAYRHYVPAGSTTVLYTHRSTGAQEHRSTGAQEHRSTGANNTHYLTTDHLSSTSSITDASGAVTVGVRNQINNSSVGTLKVIGP